MARLPYFGLVLCSITLGCLSGCGDNQDPSGAQELWNRIQAADYRNTFANPPGYDTALPSDTQHSDFSRIWVNDVVNDVIVANEPVPEWPLDSLIIKDGSNDDGEIDLVAVMEKRADGWYWAEYLDLGAPDGGPKFSGKPDICIDCHTGAANAGNDFTHAIALPK